MASRHGDVRHAGTRCGGCPAPGVQKFPHRRTVPDRRAPAAQIQEAPARRPGGAWPRRPPVLVGLPAGDGEVEDGLVEGDGRGRVGQAIPTSSIRSSTAASAASLASGRPGGACRRASSLGIVANVPPRRTGRGSSGGAMPRPMITGGRGRQSAPARLAQGPRRPPTSAASSSRPRSNVGHHRRRCRVRDHRAGAAGRRRADPVRQAAVAAASRSACRRSPSTVCLSGLDAIASRRSSSGLRVRHRGRWAAWSR